jgi:O-acetyl-ADP-ribose deacetylase (regulator of RNase III)
MIIRAEGDLLAADVDALVNTVNCVGVMGKGIALQFKRRYPDVFKEYE